MNPNNNEACLVEVYFQTPPTSFFNSQTCPIGSQKSFTFPSPRSPGPTISTVTCDRCTPQSGPSNARYVLVDSSMYIVFTWQLYTAPVNR